MLKYYINSNDSECLLQRTFYNFQENKRCKSQPVLVLKPASKLPAKVKGNKLSEIKNLKHNNKTAEKNLL